MPAGVPSPVLLFAQTTVAAAGQNTARTAPDLAELHHAASTLCSFHLALNMRRARPTTGLGPRCHRISTDLSTCCSRDISDLPRCRDAPDAEFPRTKILPAAFLNQSQARLVCSLVNSPVRGSAAASRSSGSQRHQGHTYNDKKKAAGLATNSPAA